MQQETVHCCSDRHYGPKGHPATDSTPGWHDAWARTPRPRLRLGDMDELWQFPGLAFRTGTDVDGNHDAGSSGKDVIRRGDTLFLHGHQFDSRCIRWVGRPLCRVVGFLERFSKNIDVRLGAWFQRRFRGGRYGEAMTYALRAASYARARGARQIVFGHLHVRFSMDLTFDDCLVRVVCVGACCNGALDIIPVHVTHPDGCDCGFCRED